MTIKSKLVSIFQLFRSPETPEIKQAKQKRKIEKKVVRRAALADQRPSPFSGMAQSYNRI